MVFDNKVLLEPVSTNPPSFRELFDLHANAPSFALSAFSPSAGIFTLAPIARADHDISFMIDAAPSPPPTAVATDVTIQLPWTVTVHVLAPDFPVLRPCGRGAQRCPLNGRGNLSFLDNPSTTMPWHIDSFAAPMNADIAIASFGATLVDGSRVSLGVATHSFGMASTIIVPDWQSTTIEGTRYADVRITTQPDAYEGVAAIFKTVQSRCPSCAIAFVTTWRVFTYRGASLTARALPALPAGMQITDLGGGSEPFALSSVSVLLGIDKTHPAWSSASLDGVAMVVASK